MNCRIVNTLNVSDAQQAHHNTCLRLFSPALMVYLVLPLLLGLMLVLSGCDDAGKPIARGTKIEHGSGQLPLRQPGTSAASTPDVWALPSQAAHSDQGSARVPLNSPLFNSRSEKEPVRLNLSLPDSLRYSIEAMKENTDLHLRPYSLVGEYQTFANIFQRDQDGAVSMSGRLHWDESQEAEEKPLFNTIEGLELEFSIKTQ